MSWADLFGNLSDALIALSYLMTSMLWLRILATLGLATEAVYFYVVGSTTLWVAIVWSMVFMAINVAQLTRLVRELRSMKLIGSERCLKDKTFLPFSLLSFRRLMKAGRIQTLAAGTLLTVQEAPVTHVRVLVDGMASVVVDGIEVATIRAGGIVGEMSLLTGEAASATVTVTHEARSFEITCDELNDLLFEHEDLSAEFHQSVGSALCAKLVEMRNRGNAALSARAA